MPSLLAPLLEADEPEYPYQDKKPLNPNLLVKMFNLTLDWLTLDWQLILINLSILSILFQVRFRYTSFFWNLADSEDLDVVLENRSIGTQLHPEP